MIPFLRKKFNRTNRAVFINDTSDMISFLRKKFNQTIRVLFINDTDLTPEVEIAFRRCAAHGVLYVAIELKNF